MLLCVALGAGGMWVASNYKVKFEANAATDAPPTKTDAAKGEPDKLPAHLKGEPLTDPKVRQAQNVEGATPPPAPGVNAPNTFRITKMEDGSGTSGDVLLLPPPAVGEPIRLREKSLKLTFELTDTTKTGPIKFIAQSDGGTEFEQMATEKKGVWEVDFDFSNETNYPPTSRITVKPQAEPKAAKLSLVFAGQSGQGSDKLRVELPSGTPPAVAEVFSGVYDAGVKIVDPATPPTVTLYPGYARLVVKAGESGGRYEFLLFSPATPHTLVATGTIAEQRPVSGDAIEFNLRWSKTVPASANDKPYQLVVREKFETGHADATALPVTVVAAPTPPDVTLGSISGAVKSGDVYLIGRKVIDLPLTVTPPPAANCCCSWTGRWKGCRSLTRASQHPPPATRRRSPP